LGNREVLAALELILKAEIEYGFSVDYDSQANPVIVIAPKIKANQATSDPLIGT
jgi:hypothetical protein